MLVLQLHNLTTMLTERFGQDDLEKTFIEAALKLAYELGRHNGVKEFVEARAEEITKPPFTEAKNEVKKGSK